MSNDSIRDDGLIKYMTAHRLGYGLLREFIAGKKWTQSLNQIDDDIKECKAKIDALLALKAHIIKEKCLQDVSSTDTACGQSFILHKE